MRTCVLGFEISEKFGGCVLRERKSVCVNWKTERLRRKTEPRKCGAFLVQTWTLVRMNGSNV